MPAGNPEAYGFQGLQSLNGLVRAERASTAVDTPREVVTRRGLEQAAREEFARRRQTAGFPTAISMDPDFTGAGQMPRQQAEGVLGTIKDFSPVADLEDIVHAVQDPTPLNVGVAGLAALGPVGDAAKKALRARPSLFSSSGAFRKIVPNNAERKAAAEMSETDLQQIVVGKGPSSPEQEWRKVYTGSPHKYASEPGYPMGRPRDEFIGTGEGHAAKGYGHYAAENPVVGRKYQHALSGNVDVDLLEEYFKPGNVVPSYGGHDRVIEFVKEKVPSAQGEFDDWKGVWVRAVEKKGNEWVDILGEMPRFHHTTPSAQSIKEVTGKFPGYMYEQALKVADEDFLLWDKPLRQQSEKVQDALRELGFEDTRKKWAADFDAFKQKMSDKYGYADYSVAYGRGLMTPEERAMAFALETDKASRLSVDETGMEIYDSLTRANKSKAEASKGLQSAGIRGIKFLDQGSRAEGKGTHNFVVFDPNDLEILRVLGIAGAAVGLSQIPEPRQ